MPCDRHRIQQYLKNLDFKALFTDELGWDHLQERCLNISVQEQTYVCVPLVEKRGVKVYLCEIGMQDGFPVDSRLRKIEREVIRYAYEHILISVDRTHGNQVWQWTKHEPGKPLSVYFYRLSRRQSGELLAQKLMNLAMSIEEEDRLDMLIVSGRVRATFDVERATRRFFDRFKAEHAAFLGFVEGIVKQADREWYVSLMLNRLMFVYFIQKKGFLDTTTSGALDGDVNYLSRHLKLVQEEKGRNQFQSFYRYFLLKLFHEGLGSRRRSEELDRLLGRVPYLNGGLFDIHELEHEYDAIQIPDEAFERLFKFFDEFQWYLDDRPLQNDKEINPDVIGYIFEKYINDKQKQMGA